MLHKFIFLFVIIFCAITAIFAQDNKEVYDTLFLLNGEKYAVKIVSTNTNTITYRLEGDSFMRKPLTINKNQLIKVFLRDKNEIWFCSTNNNITHSSSEPKENKVKEKQNKIVDSLIGYPIDSLIAKMGKPVEIRSFDGTKQLVYNNMDFFLKNDIVCGYTINYNPKKVVDTKKTQNIVIPNYKNPAWALVFSLAIPGGGYFYNDELSKGLYVMLGELALGSLTYICYKQIDYVPAAIASGICEIALIVVSCVESVITADELNRQHRHIVSVTPTVNELPILANNGSDMSLGMKLNIAF